MREAERIADRDDIVADSQLARVAERHAREPARVDLYDREIRAFVRADDFRRQAAVVEQRNRNLIRVLDDVMVRQNVALGRIDNDAGACGFDFVLALLLWRVLWPVEIEEAFEEFVVGERVAFRNATADRNVYNGRGDLFDHRRQARHLARGKLCPRRGSGKQCSEH